MFKPSLAYGIFFSACLGSAMAQSVDLQGIVRDKYTSQPVAGARVALSRLGYQAVADSSGRFHILQVPTSARAEASRPALRPLPGRRLAWRSPEPGQVTVRLFDPSGMPRLRQRFMLPAAGEWELPLGDLPSGIYLAVAESPTVRHSAKVVILEDGAGMPGAAEAGTIRYPRSLAKRALKATAILDTLLVTRNGYRKSVIPVTSLEESDLLLFLTDSTASSGRLAGLSVSAGSLTPAFAPAILSYTAALRQGIASVQLTPSASPGKPTVRVNGALVASGSSSAAVPLSQGPNSITVAVTSQDSSTTSIYTLDVHRAYDDTAKLTALAVSAGTLSPAFQPGILNYTVLIPATTTGLTVTARAFQPLGTLTLNGLALESGKPSQPVSVDSAETTLNLTVVSPNLARVVSYLIQVRKQASTGDDAALQSITVAPSGAVMKPFHPDTLQYVLLVEPLDSVQTITAVTRHPGATMTIRDSAQASGAPRHVVLPINWGNWWIDVTSGDGTRTRTYNVTFHRPAPYPKPVLSGPGTGVVGYKSRFSTTRAPLSVLMYCLSQSDVRYRFDFGDGDTARSSQPDSIFHVWKAPGTYAVKTQTICQDQDGPQTIFAKSPWSDPLSVTVLAADADTLPKRLISGFRTSPETWSPETTYVITGNTRFDTTALLTILPGTRVTFLNSANYLTVAALSAVGTAADSILFLDGEVRVHWRGTRSYNPDGSYRAGPRFEYCSFRNARLYVDYNIDTYGGYGFYLKHSYVPKLTGEIFRFATGSYIEHSRVDVVDGLRLFDSRVLNSYLGTMEIGADIGRALEIRRCDIKSLSIPIYNFTQATIVGNTIRRFSSPNPGKLSGNNLLASGALAVQIGGSPVDVRGNYWGETVTVEMEAKGTDQNISVIRDIFDDVALGKADYSGWLTAPVPNTLPDW